MSLLIIVMAIALFWQTNPTGFPSISRSVLVLVVAVFGFKRRLRVPTLSAANPPRRSSIRGESLGEKSAGKSVAGSSVPLTQFPDSLLKRSDRRLAAQSEREGFGVTNMFDR